jgi:hypothetical protein
MRISTAMRTCCGALTALALAATGTAADPAERPADLFVAPDGNDSWSGTHERAGGGDGPFATLARAQRAARALGRAGVVVQVAAGTYDLDETLALDPRDSGTAEAPTVYRGAGAGRSVLRGGRALGAPKPFRDAIVRFDLAAAGLGAARPRQVFVRGERQTLARYPNVDPADPHGGAWAHVAAVDDDHQQTSFHYGSDERHEWAHPDDGQVAVFAGYDWAFSIVPLAGHDAAARTISVGKPTWCPLRVGDRYAVYGMMEDLDSPGEWYADPREHALYLWPAAPLAAGDVVVPRLATLVTMAKAAHVRVQGFTLEICDGDAARLADAQDCALAACEVRNCAGTGIVIAGGTGNAARGDNVHGCGEGGISIAGGDRATLSPGRNVADNNYVHHCASWWRAYKPGVSVSGIGNTISHNLIHDLPHAGMTLDGNDNVAEFNVVHHVNLESGDTGGFYFCSRDWAQRGNIIRYNVFHHVGGYGKTNSWAPVKNGAVEFRYPHFTWGIYLDDPTSGCLVFGNILYDVPVCALHNHGGRDNTWENNVIVDCPALNVGMLDPKWNEWPGIYAKLHRALAPDAPFVKRYPELATIADTHPEAVTGVRFVRNIVYDTLAGTQAQRSEHGKGWGGDNCEQLYTVRVRAEDFPKDEWDYNCVFAEPGLELRVRLSRVGDPAHEKGETLTWPAWQAIADSHSLAADPRFEDVAKRDFRLKPDSPALKLGFKPIPVERIGPYRDAARASWPIVEAPGAAARGEFTTVRAYPVPKPPAKN